MPPTRAIPPGASPELAAMLRKAGPGWSTQQIMSAYRARQAPRPKTPKLASPSEPAMPDWATQAIGGLRAQRTAAVSAADEGANWLAGKLAPLQATMDTATRDYSDRIARLGQGYAADATAIGPALRTASGATVTGPPAPANATALAAAQTQASAVPGMRAALGLGQMGAESQGLIESAKRYALGVPLSFDSKIATMQADIGQYLENLKQQREQLAESKRSNRVSEAQRYDSAQADNALAVATLLSQGAITPKDAANLQLQSRELDLRSQDSERDYAAALQRSYASQQGKPVTPASLVTKGFRGPYAKKPAGQAVQGSDGKWYVKPAKATAGTKPLSPEQRRQWVQRVPEMLFGKLVDTGRRDENLQPIKGRQGALAGRTVFEQLVSSGFGPAEALGMMATARDESGVEYEVDATQAQRWVAARFGRAKAAAVLRELGLTGVPPVSAPPSRIRG